MALRPCLRCGNLTTAGSYCVAHRPRNGSTRHWRTTRLAVLARDKYACQRCGARASHVDHVTAVARGGRDEPGNLQALCAACNLAKGDR